MSYTLFHTHRKANRYYQMPEHPSYVTTKPLDHTTFQKGPTCKDATDAFMVSRPLHNVAIQKTLIPWAIAEGLGRRADTDSCQHLLSQLEKIFPDDTLVYKKPDDNNNICANVRSNSGTVIIGNQVCSTGPSSYSGSPTQDSRQRRQDMINRNRNR